MTESFTVEKTPPVNVFEGNLNNTILERTLSPVLNKSVRTPVKNTGTPRINQEILQEFDVILQNSADAPERADPAFTAPEIVIINEEDADPGKNIPVSSNALTYETPNLFSNFRHSGLANQKQAILLVPTITVLPATPGLNLLSQEMPELALINKFVPPLISNSFDAPASSTITVGSTEQILSLPQQIRNKISEREQRLESERFASKNAPEPKLIQSTLDSDFRLDFDVMPVRTFVMPNRKNVATNYFDASCSRKSEKSKNKGESNLRNSRRVRRDPLIFKRSEQTLNEFCTLNECASNYAPGVNFAAQDNFSTPAAPSVPIQNPTPSFAFENWKNRGPSMDFDQNALQLLSQFPPATALPPITDYSRFKVSTVPSLVVSGTLLSVSVSSCPSDTAISVPSTFVPFASIFPSVVASSCPVGPTNLVTSVVSSITSAVSSLSVAKVSDKKPVSKKVFQLKKQEPVLIDLDFSENSKARIPIMATTSLTCGGFTCPKFTGQPDENFSRFLEKFTTFTTCMRADDVMKLQLLHDASGEMAKTALEEILEEAERTETDLTFGEIISKLQESTRHNHEQRRNQFISALGARVQKQNEKVSTFMSELIKLAKGAAKLGESYDASTVRVRFLEGLREPFSHDINAHPQPEGIEALLREANRLQDYYARKDAVSNAVALIQTNAPNLLSAQPAAVPIDKPPDNVSGLG